MRCGCSTFPGVRYDLPWDKLNVVLVFAASRARDPPVRIHEDKVVMELKTRTQVACGCHGVQFQPCFVVTERVTSVSIQDGLGVTVGVPCMVGITESPAHQFSQLQLT